MKTLPLRTETQTEFRNITAEVQAASAELGVRDGWISVYIPHTTAAVTINECADPDVMRDIGHALDRLVPRRDPAYRHAEGNSAAHVKALLTGASVRIPVSGGRIRLGTWQGVFFCEFDGPRNREAWVSAG